MGSYIQRHISLFLNRDNPDKVASSGGSSVNLNVLRFTLFMSLLLTASLGGYFSFKILHHQEEKIEEVTFDSVTSHIEEVSTDNFIAKIKSLHGYRVFLKANCPTLKSWPNCTVNIDDYDTFAKGFIASADIDTCNHEALVRVDQINSFVSYVENFYSSSGYDDVAAAVNEGIFAVNETNFELYTVIKPDPTGDNEFILPIIQIVEPSVNVGALMYNIYSGSERIPLLDKIYSCIRALDGTHRNSTFNLDSIGEQCMVVTKVIKVVEDIEFRPATVMLYPVMLEVENITEVDSDVLVGRIVITVNGKTYIHVGSSTAIFYWDRILTKSVSQETHGLDILLNDGVNDYYYTFEDGIAVYYPDRSLEKSSRLHVTFPITSLFNSNFAYTLTIQVDNAFSRRYYTNGPVFACALYVGAIIFCIIQYKLYDAQTAKKWAQHDQAKRNFVRYISHEIRTPLTTVSLGIKLVMRQLRSLGLISTNPIHPNLNPLGKTEDSQIIPPVISLEGKKEQKIDGKYKRLSKTLSTKCLKRTVMPDDEVVTDSLELLSSVDGSVQVAVLILNDLLNYDKIQSGHMEISCQYLDANELILEVGDSFQVAAKAALITLVVRSNRNDPECKMRVVGENEGSLKRGSGIDCIISRSGSSVKGSSKIGPVEYITDDKYDEESLNMISSSVTENNNIFVYGDVVKLHQVLRNLISNAIKFTAEGGLITVTGSWDKTVRRGSFKGSEHDDSTEGYVSAGTFVITVEDNGVGVSAENLKAVFSDGWQFKANMLQGGQGSGLGLWITKNIVHRHHGKLACHSAGLGHGCTMRLELPVYISNNRPDVQEIELTDKYKIVDVDNEKSATVIDEENTPQVLDMEQLSGAGKCVLVVDDSTMCRKMVCRLLKRMSYECIEAKNGAVCVDILSDQARSTRIDFVLCDFEMPIMDGPAACKILRAKGHTLPIIGLTGNVLKVDTDHFISSGADAVIAKPFSIEDFQNAISSYRFD